MDKEVQDLLRGGVNDLENGLYYTGLQKLKDVLAKVEADPAKPGSDEPDFDPASDSGYPVYEEEESSSSDYEEEDEEVEPEPVPDDEDSSDSEDEDSDYSDEFSDEEDSEA